MWTGDGGREGRGTLSIVVWCLNERFEPACNERQRERERERERKRGRDRGRGRVCNILILWNIKNVHFYFHLVYSDVIIKKIRPLNQLHGSLNLFTLITSIVIRWIYKKNVTGHIYISFYDAWNKRWTDNFIHGNPSTLYFKLKRN